MLLVPVSRMIRRTWCTLGEKMFLLSVFGPTSVYMTTCTAYTDFDTVVLGFRNFSICQIWLEISWKFAEISVQFNKFQQGWISLFTISWSLNLNSVAEISDLSCEISEPYVGFNAPFERSFWGGEALQVADLSETYLASRDATLGRTIPILLQLKYH